MRVRELHIRPGNAVMHMLWRKLPDQKFTKSLYLQEGLPNEDRSCRILELKSHSMRVVRETSVSAFPKQKKNWTTYQTRTD